MIQIRSTCSLVKQNDHSFDEAIFQDISAKGYTFKLVVIYNKPRSNKIEFLNTLEDFLENTSIANQPTVICDDINIDILANNLLTRNYTELIQSFGCSLYPDEPTRLKETSATCLDHFICRDVPINYFNVFQHETISDHYPVLIKWDIDKCTIVSRPYRNTSFLKSKKTIEKFQEELYESFKGISSSFFGSAEVNESLANFKCTFEDVLNKFSPLREPKVRKEKPLWFSNTLKTLRTKRNLAHKRWRQNPHEQVFCLSLKNFERSSSKP